MLRSEIPMIVTTINESAKINCIRRLVNIDERLHIDLVGSEYPVLSISSDGTFSTVGLSIGHCPFVNYNSFF